jgi:hypothetical protein
MTEIFDISKIKESDPLKDKKINTINNIKDYVEKIDKDIKLEV